MAYLRLALIVLATILALTGLARPVEAQSARGPFQGQPIEPAQPPNEAIWAADHSVWSGPAICEN